MADIIRLADRRSNTLREGEGKVTPAQILLFTGVRYERIEPLSKRPGPGSKRARNRAEERAEA